MNDRSGALLTLADALDDVEPLDPAISRQNERAHQFARAAIGLSWSKLEPYPSERSRSIAFGQASELAGDEALLGVDLRPLAHNWRVLALCEIEIGVDVGIERRSMAKQTEADLSSVEMLIAMARYARAVANKDIAAALRLGLLAVSAYGIAQKSKASETEPTLPRQLEAKSLHMLLEEGLGSIIETIPVDLLLAHRFGGGWDAELVTRIETWCMETWGDSGPILQILKAASGEPVEVNPPASVALAGRLGSAPDLRGNPTARFQRDLLLISHTGYSMARRVLEPLVVPQIVEGWSTVVEDESFALLAPLQHLPAIEAAIVEAKSSGLRGAARVMLAAAPAVRVSLTENWRELLRQISGEGGA